ncbi:unnamed protein product, partial [Phaeothamnion confervicola]
LVVACCDVLLLLPDDLSVDWCRESADAGTAAETAESKALVGVAGLAIAAAASGSRATAAVQPVAGYLQKPTAAAAAAAGALLPHGCVAVDTGLVVFWPAAAAALAALSSNPALAGCTARGVSAGTPPLRLELYSDLLFALSG